jgi:hypothetical protein
MSTALDSNLGRFSAGLSHSKRQESKQNTKVESRKSQTIAQVLIAKVEYQKSAISAPVLDALKGGMDLPVRRPGANERDELSDGIAMSIAHDGDQIFEELPIVVQVEFLLADLLAALR